MDLRGKKVTVVGLARSGYAACKLLVDRGAVVTASDVSPAEKIQVDLEELRGRGVTLELGAHQPETFLQADLIVLSPGVDAHLPLLRKARSLGIPVWSEVELAFRACEASFVGITGTNGKSTTTTLIGLMIRQGGGKVVVAGNIGNALCSVVSGLSSEYLVVAELSSFQLETIATLRPQVAVLLNVTPDHLDRYQGMADYLTAKARIFLNQEAEDFAVFNADDPWVVEAATGARAKRVPFSRLHPLEEGAYFGGGRLVLRLRGKEEMICQASDMRIQGVHNLENALAAIATAGLLGVPAAAMDQVLRTFPGLEHRLELVADLDGVRYINDSKGTNVGAVVKSLESFPAGRVILILGGKDKGSDFHPLVPLVKERVKASILIGQARDKLRAALEGACPLCEAGNLEGAVELAATLAAPGDVVLLSPACASFDMFQDFEERGRVFKAAVRSLQVRSDQQRQ
jgi:UDP-N-acetylmuramoylalanine--D-glutamate ligase